MSWDNVGFRYLSSDNNHPLILCRRNHGARGLGQTSEADLSNSLKGVRPQEFKKD
jgi:hypothetical protein